MSDWCTTYYCITTLQEEKVISYLLSSNYKLDTEHACNSIILCRESTDQKTSYYNIKHIFKGGVKNEFSNKMVTASNITQERRVGDSAVYEDPDSSALITMSAIQGGKVGESTYELMDINSSMHEVREDSMHVTVMPAIQGDRDTYEVPESMDTAATTAPMPEDTHGVRERVYNDPDNPEATTCIPN